MKHAETSSKRHSHAVPCEGRRGLLPSIVQAALVSAVTLGSAGLAQASSDGAWAAFSEAVAKACKAQTGKTFIKPDVIVDPFGSESFGLAIVTGKLAAGGGKGSVFCVYDKKTRKVETGSELGEDKIRILKGN